MANEAYDLSRFATSRTAPVQSKKQPKVRLVENRDRLRRTQQIKKAAAIMLSSVFLLALVAGVINTQTTITELQSSIATQNKLLSDEQALNVHLTFELDSKTNLKNIEERASQLGLVKLENSQKTYIRNLEENQIEVHPNGLMQMVEDARAGLESMLGHLQTS